MLLFLLVVNVTFTFLRPSLLLTTTTLIITGGFALFSLIARSWRIPPLLDLCFIFAALFYYGMPGLFFLVYPDQNRAPSMPLQQALIGSAIATFQIARQATRWRSWTSVVGREGSSSSDPLTRQFIIALLVASLLWIAASLPGLSRYMSMEYGTRAVEQRSDMTIPLLGFNLLAIVGMALLTERLVRASRPLRWWLMGLGAFALYGIICVFIFGARTRLVWALLLPAVSLLSIRRLTVKMVIVAAVVVVALLPVFDLIGRARLTFHVGESSLSELEDVKVGEDFKTLAATSEMVAMTPIADHVIKAFGDDLLFGEYIGWSIVQAPPAFLLRPIGLVRSQSLAGRYTATYFPDVWRRGGAYGLALSAESFCNLGEFGGLFSGLVLFVFIVFFERAILRLLPFSLALAVTADFMISVARVNRGGLESLPKPIAVSAVMLGLIKLCDIATSRRVRSRLHVRATPLQ